MKLRRHIRKDNYVRAYRKKAHLSQEDVALLLGRKTGTSVSRHEMGRRKPTVETVLAYEVILGKPVAELYRHLAAKIRTDIGRRAAKLLAKCSPPGCLADVSRGRRVEELERLARAIFDKGNGK